MMVRLFGFAVVLASCTTAPTIPLGAADAIWSVPEGTHFGVEIEGNRILGWSQHCDLDDVPRRPRFAIESILGTEHPAFTVRTWHADSISYFALAGDLGGVHRSVRVDADGSVIERLHTVERDELPPAIAKLCGDRRHVPFVQGNGPDRFRIESTADDDSCIGGIYVEYASDGSKYREVLESLASLRATR